MKSTLNLAEQCAVPQQPSSSVKLNKKPNPFAKAIHKKKAPLLCDEPATAADAQDAAGRNKAVKQAVAADADPSDIVIANAEPLPTLAAPSVEPIAIEVAAVSPNAGAIAALPEAAGALWIPPASGIGGLVAGLGGLLAAAGAGGGGAAALPLVAAAPTPAPSIPTAEVPATPPQPKSITAGGALSAESDSGKAGDNVTNNAKPMLKGTATPNTNVTISLDTNGDGVADMVMNTVTDSQGNWSVTPTTKLPDGAMKGTVIASDDLGNQSPAATLSFVVDTLAPAPTITIVADTNNDGILQASEQSVSPTLNLEIGVPAGAKVGDVITLTNASDNGSQKTFTLTAADLSNGFFSTSVPKPPAGADLSVSAVLSDVAGNVSAAVSDGALVKVFVPGVTMFIKTDVNNDGVIDDTEAVGSSGTQTLSINLDNTKPGDYLLISNNGTPLYLSPITAEQIAAHTLEVPFQINEGLSANFTAVVIDSEANASAPATDSALQNQVTTDRNVVITIVPDTNNDGALSSSELGTSTTIALKIALPANAVAGHMVIVSQGTSPAGNFVLTAQNIADGFITTEVPRPLAGERLDVSAVYYDLDQPGVRHPDAIDLAVIEPVKPTITLSVASDINNDGFQNATDGVAEADWKVTLTTSGLRVGDFVMLYLNGQPINAYLVDSAILANPTIVVPFTGAQEGQKYTFSAVAINTLGIASDTATDSIVIDMVAGPTPPPIIIVADTNNDGYISRAEMGSATTIAVKITVPGDAHVGDVLTFNNGTTNTTYTLTAAQIATGFINTTMARPAEDSTIDVSATLTDGTGLVSSASTDSAVLNAVVDPALVTKAAFLNVVIASDIDNNATLEASEQNPASELVVRISLYPGAVVGEQVWYTVNGVEWNAGLSQQWIDQGYIEATIPFTATGTSLLVHAYLKDAQGNIADGGTDTATIAPYIAPPLVFSITSDLDDDGTLVPSEYGFDTTASLRITLANSAKLGDILVLEDGAGGTRSITLTNAMINAHGVDTTWALPAIDTTLSLTAHMLSAAGAVSTYLNDSVFYSSTDSSSFSVI